MSTLLPKDLWPINHIDWERHLPVLNSHALGEAYEAYVIRRYGHIRGIGQASAVPIQECYVVPMVRQCPTIWQYHSAKRTSTGPLKFGSFDATTGVDLKQSAPQSAYDAILENDRVILVGPPGAGATTLLRWLATEAINPLNSFNKIPIIVQLDALNDLDIPTYIANQFALCGVEDSEIHVANLLASGAAVVLFDGLDEASTSKTARQELIGELLLFTEHYRENKFVITTRLAMAEYDLESFAYFELLPFENQQIEIFIHTWFTDDLLKSTALAQHLTTTQDVKLRSLAQSPLTLSLLCLVYAETKQLPTERWKLYKFATDVLFKRQRDTQPLPPEERLTPFQKRQLLTLIATLTFNRGELLISRQRLLEITDNFLMYLPYIKALDAAAVLEDLIVQPRLLSKRGPGWYAFQHLTFQEYFVSRHIVADRSGRLQRQLLSKHAMKTSWREVILLTVEQLRNADAFYAHFSAQLVRLASASGMKTLLLENAEMAASPELRDHWRVFTARTWAVRELSYLTRTLSMELTLKWTLYLANSIDPDLAQPLTRVLRLDLRQAQAQALARTLSLDFDKTLTLSRAQALLQAGALNTDLARAMAVSQAIDWAFDEDYKATLQQARMQAELVSALVMALIILIYSGDAVLIKAARDLAQLAVNSNRLALPGVDWRSQMQHITLMNWEGDLRLTVAKTLVELAHNILNLGMRTPVDWNNINNYLQLIELYLSSSRIAVVDQRPQLLAKVLYPIAD